MRRFNSDKFPKLSVCLYSAPDNPEQIIAHNYLECIEDRQIDDPADIAFDDAKKITEWVVKGGHTPALESVYLGINIRGMSKVVSHQIVRHRIGVSIGQRTQRANSQEYLGNFSHGKHYILPPSLQELFDTKWDLGTSDPRQSAGRMLREYLHNSERIYNALIKVGVSEDEARYIIPQAAETSMDFNIILKALVGTASTRLCELMQGEMVEIFRLIKLAIVDWNPMIGSMLKPICMITGKCNRNENNPTDDFPKGACFYTKSGVIPCRKKDNTFDLTKYSKSASE